MRLELRRTTVSRHPVWLPWDLAGRLADKWSREGMVAIFFIEIGLSSIATGMAQTPLQLRIGLFFFGVAAAIYHPVGLAIVTQRWKVGGASP